MTRSTPTVKVQDGDNGPFAEVEINGWMVVVHESSTDPGYLYVEVAGDNLDDDVAGSGRLKLHINEHLVYMGDTQAPAPDHVCVRCGTNTSDPEVLVSADERCMATPNGVGAHDLRALPLEDSEPALLTLALEYIGNQQSDEAWEDFLAERGVDDTGAPLPEGRT